MKRNDYLSQKTERILLDHVDIKTMSKVHTIDPEDIKALIHEYSTDTYSEGAMKFYLQEDLGLEEHDSIHLSQRARMYFDTLTELYWDEEYNFE